MALSISDYFKGNIYTHYDLDDPARHLKPPPAATRRRHHGRNAPGPEIIGVLTDTTPADPPLPGRPACTDADPEIFFPERVNRETTAAAKAICGRCPVRQPCLESALAYEADQEHRSHVHGVYGGTTPNERRTIRWRRREEAREALTPKPAAPQVRHPPQVRNHHPVVDLDQPHGGRRITREEWLARREDTG